MDTSIGQECLNECAMSKGNQMNFHYPEFIFMFIDENYLALFLVIYIITYSLWSSKNTQVMKGAESQKTKSVL